MGTYGYTAPEYVATGHLYVKSDVYGFGVVLPEMLTGPRAMDRARPADQNNLADRRRLARLVDPRIGPVPVQVRTAGGPAHAVMPLAGDPNSRPSMAEVVASLEEIARESTAPFVAVAARKGWLRKPEESLLYY